MFIWPADLHGAVLQSTEDTDAIIAMCGDAGVQFMDGSMWTHNPRVKALEAVLRDQSAVGELVTVHSIFHNIFPGVPILQEALHGSFAA